METRTQVKARVRCECGELATKRQTYLLEGSRSNPASSAYGRDDCSWCEDTARYWCGKPACKPETPDGYESCSTFMFGERFQHLFMEWQTVDSESSALQGGG